jgi:hypothetical protein
MSRWELTLKTWQDGEQRDAHTPACCLPSLDSEAVVIPFLAIAFLSHAQTISASLHALGLFVLCLFPFPLCTRNLTHPLYSTPSSFNTLRLVRWLLSDGARALGEACLRHAWPGKRLASRWPGPCLARLVELMAVDPTWANTLCALRAQGPRPVLVRELTERTPDDGYDDNSEEILIKCVR